MNITDKVLNFRKFILSSWPSINVVFDTLDWDNDMEFLDDWFQANWELLVERQIGLSDDEGLGEYGTAPTLYRKIINLTDSKYIQRHPCVTHRVLCLEKKTNKRYFFHRLIQKKGFLSSYRADCPPYNFVSVSEYPKPKQPIKHAIFDRPIKDFEFIIEKIK